MTGWLDIIPYEEILPSASHLKETHNRITEQSNKRHFICTQTALYPDQITILHAYPTWIQHGYILYVKGWIITVYCFSFLFFLFFGGILINTQTQTHVHKSSSCFKTDLLTSCSCRQLIPSCTLRLRIRTLYSYYYIYCNRYDISCQSKCENASDLRVPNHTQLIQPGHNVVTFCMLLI